MDSKENARQAAEDRTIMVMGDGVARRGMGGRGMAVARMLAAAAGMVITSASDGVVRANNMGLNMAKAMSGSKQRSSFNQQNAPRGNANAMGSNANARRAAAKKRRVKAHRARR